jgi:hypothetical protein
MFEEVELLREKGHVPRVELLAEKFVDAISYAPHVQF